MDSWLEFAFCIEFAGLWEEFENTTTAKLKKKIRGKNLAYYAANLPPDRTFEVSVETVDDGGALTSAWIAGVEEARRSLEFASEQEIDAVYAKHGA